MFKNGILLEEVEKYVLDCFDASDAEKRGRTGRFPNLAGFCRRLGTSPSHLASLGEEYPELYEAILSVFEDEALNSSQSPTLLTAYMKERLGFGEKKEPASAVQSGDVRLIFEHDVSEDGI